MHAAPRMSRAPRRSGGGPGGHPDHPAARHGVPGTHHQVHQHLLHLPRIGEDRADGVEDLGVGRRQRDHAPGEGGRGRPEQPDAAKTSAAPRSSS